MIRLDYNIKGFIVTVISSSLFRGNTNMNVPCGESSDFNQDLNPGPPSYWPCQCYKRWVTET